LAHLLGLSITSPGEQNIMQANVHPATSPSQNFSIVSEFCLKSFRFLVISLDELAEDKRITISDNATGDLPFSILGQFEFDGHYYAIAYDWSIPETIDPSFTCLLTGRELQIAALIALGWSNRQVANQLHISEWTVSAHLRRIFIKLNVDSRAAMVYRCASLINQLHQF
jgi:DNA-binding CsgD family transcriptional regulator